MSNDKMFQVNIEFKENKKLKIIHTIFIGFLAISLILFFVFLAKENNVVSAFSVVVACVISCIITVIKEYIVQIESAEFTISESVLHIKSDTYSIDKNIDMKECKIIKFNNQLIFYNKERHEKDFDITLIDLKEATSVYEKLQQYFEKYN